MVNRKIGEMTMQITVSAIFSDPRAHNDEAIEVLLLEQLCCGSPWLNEE